MPSGKRRSKLRQRSTGTSDKKTAQKIADKWEEESRRPESEMSMTQMRKVMAEIYLRMKKQDAKLNMTIREFGARWIRGKKVEGLAHSTLAFYRSAVTSFSDFLDKRGRGGCQVFEITPADVTDYRDLMSEEGLSRTTVNHHIKALRMLLTAAKQEGWTPDNAAQQVKTLKVRRADKQKARPFSLEQVKAILDVCPEEWKSIVRLAFYTGKRLIDVAMLMESQVDVFKKVIAWEIQKTDATEFSPIHRALQAELMKRDWSDKGDRPMHPKAHSLVNRTTGTSRSSALSKQFEHILIHAGLREKKVAETGAKQSRRRERQPYTFHSLRHTLSTNLAGLSVDKRVAMELVGHESENVHDGYTHFPLELLREAIEKLPVI